MALSNNLIIFHFFKCLSRWNIDTVMNILWWTLALAIELSFLDQFEWINVDHWYCHMELFLKICPIKQISFCPTFTFRFICSGFLSEWYCNHFYEVNNDNFKPLPKPGFLGHWILNICTGMQFRRKVQNIGEATQKRT